MNSLVVPGRVASSHARPSAAARVRLAPRAHPRVLALTFRDARRGRRRAAVAALLGRPPAGRFAVVVRRADGSPGGDRERAPPARRHADADALLAGRPRAARRGEPPRGRRRGRTDSRPRSTPTRSPRPTRATPRAAARRIVRADALAPRGGVGGTREGVKCLHAHLANYLAGGEDPVGELVAAEVARARPRRRGRPWLRSSRPSTAARTRRACSWSTRRHVLHRETRITRLVQGVDASRRCCPTPRSSARSRCSTSTARSWTPTASARAARGDVGGARRGQRRGVPGRGRRAHRGRGRAAQRRGGGALLLRRRDGRPRRRRPRRRWSSTSAAGRPSSRRDVDGELVQLLDAAGLRARDRARPRARPSCAGARRRGRAR